MTHAPHNGSGIPAPSGTRPEGVWALVAMAFLLVVTVGWWALALWPVPGSGAEWLERARAVCFNTTETGLPDASGWLLLIGQPLGMFGVLVVGWRDGVRSAFRILLGSVPGQATLATTLLLVTAGLGAAGIRVVRAEAATAPPELPGTEASAATSPRLDQEPGPLGLVDQSGRQVTLERFRGRPVLVTFAFGHCETICPVVVEASLEARDRIAETGAADPVVVVITLDPWRDTPSRLPHLAEQWKLDRDAHVLSGPVETVERVLDDWNVARDRDPATGDVIHPALVYVVDREGRVAFASTGRPADLVTLVGRL